MSISFKNMQEKNYFMSILQDIEKDKKNASERLKSEKEILALDWNAQQAVKYGYLPKQKLTTLSEADFAILRKTADKDDKIALFEMGRCCARKLCGMESNNAAYYFKKSAGLGYAPAQYNLAIYYFKTELSKSIELLSMAASAGYASAQTKLAICYLGNQGVEPCSNNLLLAFDWFKKAHLQGEAISFEGLKTCLKYFREYHLPYPHSTELDLSLLEEMPIVTPVKQHFSYLPTSSLLKKTAEEVTQLLIQTSNLCKESLLNNPKAILDLSNSLFDASRCYLHGIHVKKQPDLGIEYCKRAAKLNFAPAQDLLGSIYLELAEKTNSNKERQIKLYQQSYEFYLQAAENHFARGQYNLAIFYQKNYILQLKNATTIAFKWFMCAALQGNANAEKQVKKCILQRNGVPEDLLAPLKPTIAPTEATNTQVVAISTHFSALKRKNSLLLVKKVTSTSTKKEEIDNKRIKIS